MDIATVKLLALYNRSVNDKMYEKLANLSEEQWTRKFGGFFSSIKSLANHLYIADFNWLKRFSKLRDFGYAKDPYFARNIGFDETPLASLVDYARERKVMDGWIDRFADEVTEADLHQKLVYQDSHGTRYEKDFGGLILNMVNHDTHHRAMISLYLDELGIANDFSSLNAVL